MAPWNRRRQHRRYPAELVVHDGEVAAVQRFDLTNPNHVEALVKGQQEWQTAAWFYADTVGELIDARRFVENSFRRIALTVGFQREPDDQPINVMDARAPGDGGPERKPDAPAIAAEDFVPAAVAQQAEDIIRSFAARDGGQPILMGKLGVNIFIGGEAFIVNRKVLARRPTREETPAQVPTVMDWEVRSKDEIRRNSSGAKEGDSEVEVVDSPDQRVGVPVGRDAFVERIWRQHPRWSAWADSNVRAATGTLEELDLLAKLARASIRSRLVAGLVLLPDELDFGAADQPLDGQPQPRRGVSFDRDIAQAFAAVVSNEADANSVAPLGLRGKAEWLKEVRLLEFPRRYSEEDRQQYEQAVTRLARTIELPMERIIGMSDVNHWTAWQIDEETYEAYIEPLVGIGAEGLTFGLLRPMLLEEGVPEEIVSRLVVMADASQLVRRPDRGKVASEGYGLETPTLGGATWRRANGYGDDDAPSDEELLRRLVFAGKLEASLVTKLLGVWEMLPPELVAQQEAERQAMQDALGGNDDGEDDAEDDGPESGGGPTGNEGEPPDRPSDSPAAMAAAARPTQEGITGDMLGAADRVLAERLLVAADSAMTRALEKAAARLRSQARAHPQQFGITASTASQARAEVARRLEGVPPVGVAAALGEAAVSAVQADEELWADAFTELERQWTPWVSATQEFVLGALTGFGLSARQRAEMAARQEDDRSDAWLWLLAALLGAAQATAARGAGPDTPEAGEFDPTLTVEPAIIREAIARAGGAEVSVERFGGLLNAAGQPLGGIATGDLARAYFTAAGFPWRGYRWEYGDVSLRQQPYEPHRALAGLVFERWEDGSLANASGGWPGVTSYYPGDHRHCRCSFTPVLELPSAG